MGYVYCAFGKRVMKSYNNNTTIYFFDGINTLQEDYKASAWSNFSTNDVYTLTPGVIGHIISKRNYTNGTTDLYYHYDPIGNVMFITDCYGNITVSYVQEGFGNVLATNGSLTSDFWHLTSKEQEHDPATGLYYFFARWYDPVTGRWISQEPTGLDGPNLYWYVGDDPINWLDPDGLKKERKKSWWDRFWDWCGKFNRAKNIYDKGNTVYQNGKIVKRTCDFMDKKSKECEEKCNKEIPDGMDVRFTQCYKQCMHPGMVKLTQDGADIVISRYP
jgi:RHS repeat-associated protein